VKKIVLAAALASFANASYAYDIGPFDDLLVFGDSLSDPGNVVNEVFGGFPNIPGVSITNTDAYPNGQWTDGTTWAHKLGATYESGKNFAYGGARAASQNPDSPLILDLFEQVDQYETPSDLGSNPITAIFIGGNDFLGYFNPEDPTPKPPLNEFIGGVIASIGQSVGALGAKGLTDFVVFGLPDLGKQPGLPAEQAAGLTELAGQFNFFLNQMVQGLNTAPNGISASFFDVAYVLAPIFGDDSPFGVKDAPCVLKDENDNVTSICDDPENYVFYDAVHPTDGVHSLIAEAFVDHVTPVPLPAGAPLLLVALGALGVASRRRVAGRSD